MLLMDYLSYHRDSQTIKNIVLKLAEKNKQVVYGGQSTNAQLPFNLRRKTSDFDILTKKSKYFAQELVKQLNKEYGEEKFKMESASHKGTFKVKDKEGNTIADYTQTTKKPKSKVILGIRYANIGYSEKKLKKVLKDPNSSFRHSKDLDTINRIKQFKKIKIW